MAKYIIDIPDEVPVSDELVPFDMCRPSWYWEAYKKGKAEAENEVWDFASYIALEMDGIQKDECFGNLATISYQEAKEKYEKWVNQTTEIHVGDEVEDNDGTRGIVFDIIGTDLLGVCWEEERVSHFFWPKSYCRKTGRHFDEAEKLLERMKAE